MGYHFKFFKLLVFPWTTLGTTKSNLPNPSLFNVVLTQKVVQEWQCLIKCITQQIQYSVILTSELFKSGNIVQVNNYLDKHLVPTFGNWLFLIIRATDTVWSEVKQHQRWTLSSTHNMSLYRRPVQTAATVSMSCQSAEYRQKVVNNSIENLFTGRKKMYTNWWKVVEPKKIVRDVKREREQETEKGGDWVEMMPLARKSSAQHTPTANQTSPSLPLGQRAHLAPVTLNNTLNKPNKY